MAYTGIWDGLDHYDASKEVWDIVNVSGAMTYSSAYARFPAAANCVSKGLKIGPNFSAPYKVKNLSGNFARYYAGFPICVPVAPASNVGIIAFRDSGTTQFYISISNAGAIQVRSAGGAILATTAPGTYVFGQYPWLDFDVTIGLPGAVLIYLSVPAGSAPLLNASVNTKNTANATLNQIQIGDFAGSGVAIYYDDVHCHDFGGGAPNSILGEGTRIYTKLPNAAGGSALWTPNGAAANWQCVDEAVPDDDTTYVAASTAVKDNYGVGAAGLIGTVNGLVRRSRVRKDDGLAHTFQNGVRSGGVDALAAPYTVGAAYAYTDGYTIIDPNTGFAFTAPNADLATPTILETT